MNENDARLRTATSRDTSIFPDEDDVNENVAKDKQRSNIERPNTATSQDYQSTDNTPTELYNDTDDGTGNSP